MNRILVVDDTALNIQLIAHCLKDDYQIMVAKDGQRALDLVNGDEPPDLILLDIEMPGKNGYQVCEELKQNDSTAHIPVIFITGKLEMEAEEYGLSLGAVDYIVKPLHPAILRARVKTHITLKNQRDELQAMAMYDQLTHLYNRHYLFDIAHKKTANTVRHGDSLSVLLMDLDHFKSINDTHGHAMGDEVLKGVARIIIKNCRREDIAARLGGEEFVILLDRCPPQEALTKAEQLCQTIAQIPIGDLTVTTSIGVATLSALDRDFNDVLTRADQALYEAKAQGRNRVLAWHDNA